MHKLGIRLFLVIVSSLINFAGVSLARSTQSDNTLIHANGLGQLISVSNNMSTRPSIDEYLNKRSDFFKMENSLAIGADIILTERELLANEILMAAKTDEVKAGFFNPSSFAPSRHLFEVLDQIKASKLFHLIKRMPKGAVLHAHDTALCSTDYVVSLTYLPHLWQCHDTYLDTISFKFSRDPPAAISGCEWTLVSKERQKKGKRYDIDLRKRFSLYTKTPEMDFSDINVVWKRFIGIFVTITPLLTYAPVWKGYFKQALTEFYADNVQYLEFRGTLPQLYDLDGNNYTQADAVQIYIDALNEFKQDHPGFIGSKFIYAPNRKVDDSTFSRYMKTAVDLQNRFPNFVAGFDLVSQEDLGRPLIDYANVLLELPNDINFFFHAGETNWYGTSSDENLVDAVLLGTKRIGHGYAILKHPSVLRAVKEQGIAIEVNPISNQVLKLNDDNRNHPCSFLFANNYPVVISSDDPSFWEAKPLSHDFYIAFLGIASAQADLRALKQLAINSIAYSSLNSAEKEVAFSKWTAEWDEYVEWLIDGSVSSVLSNVIP